MSYYGSNDIDTASLVNDDILTRSSVSRRLTTEELQHVAKDDQGMPANLTRQRGGTVVQIVGQSIYTDRASPVDKRSEEKNKRDLHRYGHQDSRSDRFYNSVESGTEPITDQRAYPPTVRLHQSKHLPEWIWVCITALLGINQSKRYLATALYVFTISSALAFTVLGVAFIAFDIYSKNSKTTAHTGFIALLIGFSWICLGIYSFRLAGRLFGNPNFAASIRTHSRTLLKISSAALLVLLGIGFTVINLYQAADTYEAGFCKNVSLPPVVCHLMYITRILFTAIAMFWNLMVGCMLLSVCRTHTIGIRRFVQDLIDDGRKYEAFWKGRLQNSRHGEFRQETCSILNNEEWFLLHDDIYNHPTVADDELGEDGHQGDQNQAEGSSVFTPEGGGASNVVTVAQEDISGSIDQEEPSDDTVDTDTPPIMSQEELLLCYWKISSRMRYTSMCLQRWLASWIAFVLLWSADYVIYWLSSSPSILGGAEFCIPVLLLLVLCSAYAEVNGEGQTMIRCICPTKERYGLLAYLYQQPLQMQVFGLSISYNAILTVILAFSVAFSSRLILDEVMKN